MAEYDILREHTTYERNRVAQLSSIALGYLLLVGGAFVHSQALRWLVSGGAGLATVAAAATSRNVSVTGGVLSDFTVTSNINRTRDFLSGGSSGAWTPTLFDWQSLKVTPPNDKFKHVFVVAETGVGKTTLLEYLSEEVMGNEQYFLSPAWQHGQFPRAKAIGAGENYGSLNTRHLLSDEDLRIDSWKHSLSSGYITLDEKYKRRAALYVEGKTENLIDVIIDEYNSQVANIPDLSKLTHKWVSQGRKYFFRLYVAAPLSTVVALDMAGQGALRDSFTFIRLGSAARNLAQELHAQDPRRYPIEWLRYVQEMKLPCLVEDQIALIPDRSEKKSEPSRSKVQQEPNKVEKAEPASTLPTVEPSKLTPADFFLYQAMRGAAETTQTKAKAIRKLPHSREPEDYAWYKSEWDRLEGLFGKIPFGTSTGIKKAGGSDE